MTVMLVTTRWVFRCPDCPWATGQRSYDAGRDEFIVHCEVVHVRPKIDPLRFVVGEINTQVTTSITTYGRPWTRIG